MKVHLMLLLFSFFFTVRLLSQTPPPTPELLSERVLLVGKFNKPEPIPYTAGMILSKAIIAAGGITSLANPRLYLIRCGKSEKIDLNRLVSDPSSDRVLQPWDILYLNP